MNVSSTGIKQHTTRGGNTIYFGAKGVSNEAGTRGAAGRFVAVDKGSDGSIDAAKGGFVAAGPNGAVGARAAIGPNGYKAAAFATNYENAKVWKKYG